MRKGILIGLAATAALALPAPATADNGLFRQGTQITFPDVGQGNPYPSELAVSGLTGTVSRVSIQIALTKAVPDDVDLILIGPQGQRSMVLSDAGGTNAVSNLSITFDDASALVEPDSAALGAGTFKPTDYEPGDTFNAPVPGPPHGAQLSAFNGTNPNGTWKLYAQDDLFNTTGGSIAEWTLFITTAQPASGGGGTPGGGGTGTTPTGNPPDPDTTPATIESCTARSQRISIARAITACLRSSEVGTFTAAGTLRVGTQRFTLTPRSTAVTRPVRTRRLSVPISTRIRTALVLGLAQRKAVTFALTLTHVDAAANRSVTNATGRQPLPVLRRRLATTAAVRDCSAAVDFNLRITSARNMTCGAAKFDMKRYRGSIAYRFRTPAGFTCTRASGTRISGTWRCAKGTRAYRFAFSD
jgi:subtilisin-like proprotein convertase family protein